MNMEEYQENITLLRFMLAELLEKQSSPLITSYKRNQYRTGIRALKSAIEALEVQVLA